MTIVAPGLAQPESSSFRGFREDERCRFRPLKDRGLRVVVRLTYACDLFCRHCLVGTRSRAGELDTPSWARVLAELPDIRAKKVLLTGGEPLLRDDLPEIVRFISAMGIPVDLNSNLQRMTLPLLRELRQAGLTEISTALQGPREVHDSLHGRPGAFDQSVRAIRWAADLGIQVDVACCLTRENSHHLKSLIAIVQGLPVQSLTLSRTFPIGHGSTNQSSPDQRHLAAIYEDCKQNLLPQSPLPIRVVGLLNPPSQHDCRRGDSVIGIKPDGGLQGCVLASENPTEVSHPLAVGLERSLHDLRQQMSTREYGLCWKWQEASP